MSNPHPPPLDQEPHQEDDFGRKIALFFVPILMGLMLLSMLNSAHQNSLNTIYFLQASSWHETTIDFNEDKYHFVFEEYRKNKKRYFSVYEHQRLIYEVSCEVQLFQLCKLLKDNRPNTLQALNFYQHQSNKQQLQLKSVFYQTDTGEPKRISLMTSPPNAPEKILQEKRCLLMITLFALFLFCAIACGIYQLKQLPRYVKFGLCLILMLNGIYLLFKCLTIFI